MLDLIRGRARGDRGAVAALVAILFAGGVVLGMGALAVDVGRLYAEREELQSGADAAATAVAKCVAQPDAPGCGGFAPLSVAEMYADDNATDGAAAVTVLCGSLPGAGLPGCPEQPDNLTRCVNDPPETDYVEVRTATELPDGSTLLPPTLAQTMLGNEGYEGTTVGACARASWGAPAAAQSLAITISACEWALHTGDGTDFAPTPPPPPPPSYEKTIKLHTTSGDPRCPAGPSGWDRPGGFGWVDDDGNCQVQLNADGTYGGSTGNHAPQGSCSDMLRAAVDSGEPVLVPIYQSVSGSGNNTTYHIAGFAAFVITGYFWPSDKYLEKRLDPAVNKCSGSDRCIFGYFTQALVPATGPVGGPQFGATIVTLVG